MTSSPITTISNKNQDKSQQEPSLPQEKTFQIRMTPDQWSKVEDNPRQRDTERHLKRATHLLTPSPTHSYVSMATTYDGNNSWKLDGHTRSLLWQKSPNLAPSSIHVTVYRVKDQEEASNLYTHFDSPQAVETPTDRVFGAIHEQNWKPSSSLFQEGKCITTACLLAQGIVEDKFLSKGNRIPIYNLLPLWLEELKLLDSIYPNRSKFTSHLVCAALLTLRRRLHNPKFISQTLEFWKLYQNDKGVKLENQMDGVEALTRIISKSKSEPHSTKKVYDLISRSITSFEGWRRKHQYSSLPKKTDLKEYVSQIPPNIKI